MSKQNTPTTSAEVIESFKNLGLPSEQLDEMLRAFSVGASTHFAVMYNEVRHNTPEFLSTCSYIDLLPKADLDTLVDADETDARKDFAAAFLVTRCVALRSGSLEELYNGEFA